MAASASDSGSSHANSESVYSADENTDKDIALTKLDGSVLLASLLEERCVSLEQDSDRGQKLFADVCAYLSKNEVLKSLNNEKEMSQQKEILDQLIRSMAQNTMKEEMATSVVQNTRYTKEFEEIEKLGDGGFGTVYKAKHKLDGQKYAVKKIDLKQNIDITKPLREIRVLAVLKHDNIIGYHSSWLEDDNRVSASAESSYDESEGSSESTSDNVDIHREKVLQGPQAMKAIQMLYIQLELCDCTLGKWLEERNKSPNISTENLHPDTKRMFIGILSGVQYIHSNYLMHRDLTPQNIFLCGPDHRVKIGDFGLVKGVHGSDSVLSPPTTEGVPIDLINTEDIGHQLYGSPELLQGRTCDTKCDMYSLGVLLFELCNTFTTYTERYDRIRELRKKFCPGELERVLSKREAHLINDLINNLISPEPDQRPTAEAVLRNPLFATTTEQQTLQQLNPQAQKRDQTFNEQGLSFNEQGLSFNEQGLSFNEQGLSFNEQGLNPKEQDQENAVESSREASSGAYVQFMGYVRKTKE